MHALLRFGADRVPEVPFRIPRWLMGTLTALKLLPDCSVVLRKDTGEMQILLQFIDTSDGEALRICLGVCKDSDTGALDVGRTFHWARAEPGHMENRKDEAWHTRVHDCFQDHIDAWPARAKAFGDEKRTIRLAFTPCQHAPRTTRVLHVELTGSVYEKRQRAAGINLPSTGVLGSTEREVAPSTKESDRESKKGLGWGAHVRALATRVRGSLDHQDAENLLTNEGRTDDASRTLVAESHSHTSTVGRGVVEVLRETWRGRPLSRLVSKD